MTTLSHAAPATIIARPPCRSVPLSRPARRERQHVVRVFLPDAERVVALATDGTERELERIDHAGLFAGPVDDPSALPAARPLRRQRSRTGRPLSLPADAVRLRPLSARRRQPSALLRQARRASDAMDGVDGVAFVVLGAERAARQRRRRFQFLGRPAPRHARARQWLLGNLRARRPRRRQIQIRDRRRERRAPAA